MAKEPEAAYKVSEGPVTSSIPHASADEAEDTPTYQGQPLVLGIARDPKTLFVCWSVDWPAAFGNGLPPDRSAHVRIKSGAEEQQTIRVEPLRGNCVIDQLKPGETYSIELGYYAPVGVWNIVVSGNEVMMPFDSGPANEGPIDVATVPFHLTFQRMLDIFRLKNGENVIEYLARLQERGAHSELLAPEDTEIFRALGLSRDELQRAARTRDALVEMPDVRERAETIFGFGGSSWS